VPRRGWHPWAEHSTLTSITEVVGCPLLPPPPVPAVAPKLHRSSPAAVGGAAAAATVLTCLTRLPSSAGDTSVIHMEVYGRGGDGKVGMSVYYALLAAEHAEDTMRVGRVLPEAPAAKHWYTTHSCHTASTCC
jgi:hypothetical protein